MVSRRGWESFKNVFEDLTKAGVEQQSWGKKSSNKDLGGSFAKPNNKGDEIAGFSSEDDDESASTPLSSVKRACNNLKALTNKRKQLKKEDENFESSLTRPRTSNSHAKQIIRKLRSDGFVDPFKTEQFPARPCDVFACTDKNKNDSEITWSDSDSESTKDKTPFSSQSVKQAEPVIQVNDTIGDFNSEDESVGEEICNKGSTPSISPNTPTPPPAPCSPTGSEYQPPLSSSKKRKQKYLRGGLAARLQKLSIQENSKRSFWSHKIRQMDRENDSGSSSGSTQGTVIVQVLSERLDHGVYVMRCHVTSQEVDFILPNHLIILLEKERRIKLSSKRLRIYSPWQIVELPNYSSPVMMCLAHCETNSSLIPEVHRQSSEDTKHEASEVAVTRENLSTILDQYDMNDLNVPMETVIDWNPVEGYQGLCMVSRVNVIARVQKVYWRSVVTRSLDLNSASSLTNSIIESQPKAKSMSFCFLLQDFTGTCCEVRAPEYQLLRSWQEILRKSEGKVLSFSKLLLTGHQRRQRNGELFRFIDDLRRKYLRQMQASGQQQICSTFLIDEQASVALVSEERVLERCSSCCSPESLASIVDSRRVKVRGVLLHIKCTSEEYHNFRHIRLWLSSISHEYNVIIEPAVIQVRYASDRAVEWDESTLLAGQLLSCEDLVYDKANPAILRADIFSKIQVIATNSSRSDEPSRDIHELWRSTMTVTISDEEYTQLRSIPVPKFPELSENCQLASLVMFQGTIYDVDLEKAFSWFTCYDCQSENITEPDEGLQYHCNSCCQEFETPNTNFHLEVYVKSQTGLNVKVKLLQETITSLLSGSEERSKEGLYDVKCVLNKHVGPLHCIIVEKDRDCQISYKLEQIDNVHRKG